MCTTCGCHSDSVTVGNDHFHRHLGPLGASHTHAVSSARVVQIERDILSLNDAKASKNRHYLAQRGVLAFNVISSPGSGKTSLLAATITALGNRFPVSVIEGDQQTDRDAERIRATGAKAVQINTGKGCHLDAEMVGRAIGQIDPAKESILFIENVGNLVCPAGFDLGEAAKIVILSVTEGEDKPLKYPDIFRASRLMILNKSDLLPHVTFDAETCISYARRINPDIEIIVMSAVTSDGLEQWLQWIEAQRQERVKQPEIG
jgi:hydrogenase nickel incorporation protein HypB